MADFAPTHPGEILMTEFLEPMGITQYRIAKAIDVSNVGIFNPATQKADRVGFKVLEDGRKVRFFKSNGELVDA